LEDELFGFAVGTERLKLLVLCCERIRFWLALSKTLLLKLDWFTGCLLITPVVGFVAGLVAG
jgi:hypothetical protein